MSGTIEYGRNAATAPVNHDRAHAKHFQRTARVSAFIAWKGVVDRPLAVLLLIPGLPMISLLWLLIRASSPGPGIYRQQRVGLHGRTFYMLKLRSMRQDAEAASGAVWCSQHDPRVTWIGTLLRKFHLDELPQLFNVLKGEMSLVGPRPERPEFVEVLSERLDGYRQRLAVPPGITGLAQLNLPPDTDLVSVARKLVLDLEYIEQASLWLEARLLVCTATCLVKIPTMKLLSVARTVQLADETDVRPGSATSPATVDTIRAAGLAAETIASSVHENGGRRRESGKCHTSRRSRPWSPR